MAMLRDEEAIEFLLTVFTEESQSTAEDALFALEMYRDDRAIWNRVEKIAETRNDIKLK